MPRKIAYIKESSIYYDDSLSPKFKGGVSLRSLLIKELKSLGYSAIDPCCPNVLGLRPLVYNSSTGQDGVMIDGEFVAVETASGASTTTTTSTTSTTTTVAP